MSVPPQESAQSWYYNTPYPPMLVPAIQYPQISSPTSSQYTSESSPSPTEYPYSYLQMISPQNLPVPVSDPSCATAQSYQNQNQQYQHQHHHNHHHHAQRSTIIIPTTFPVLANDPAPGPPPKSRTVKSSVASTRKTQIAHPYARLFAKKDEVKRRKTWNHVLEKSIFSPYELSTLSAPQRRSIYIASLEAHIDHLHDRLFSMGFWPVSFEELDQFKGLNSKTAKSMVAGLQHDASICKLKLLELERANKDLQKILSNLPPEP